MSDPSNPIAAWSEIGAWWVAIAGGAMAAYKAIQELHESNRQRHDAIEQRKDDLRWRRAEMAKQCLDEIRHDPAAAAAMKMIDWQNLRFIMSDGHQTAQIPRARRHSALRTTNLEFGDQERFIRDAFDAFFDGLQSLEHYIGISLIEFEDVSPALTYYVDKLAHPSEFHVMYTYMSEYGFKDALMLLDRFPAWKDAAANAGPPMTAAY